MLYSLLKFFLSLPVKLFWLKKVEGIENIPKKGGVILACNHQSWLDAVIIGIISKRRLYYLVAEKIYDSCFLKWIFKLTNQIRIDRRSGVKNLEAIEKSVKLLKQGQVLCIFPEGGLKPSKEIRRGYTGAARFALLAQSPIIPIGIKNSFDIFPCHKKFPNFKKICEARIGQPMFFKEYYGLEHNVEILQEITDKVMREVGRLIKQE